MDTEAKIQVDDTRIMLADLSNMNGDTMAWFMKKRAEIRAQAPMICDTIINYHGPFLNYI
jgi:hypothetical protein